MNIESNELKLKVTENSPLTDLDNKSIPPMWDLPSYRSIAHRERAVEFRRLWALVNVYFTRAVKRVEPTQHKVNAATSLAGSHAK